MEDESAVKRNERIKCILHLLKAGDENIKLPPSGNDDVILWVGNTGGGKSTISQFVSYLNDTLISVETSPNSREYIVSDVSNRISIQSIKSKTIFPELIVNEETKTIFYDCPGFSDTRSAVYDIAATCFTKKVVDAAKKVKLLFVVSYPSVRKGVDRQDFMLLLKHSLNFVKNIDKFKNSVALLITKVDNHYYKTADGSLKLVSDDIVVSSIADYLLEVKESLNEKIRTTNDFIANPRKFYENGIKFIDILLEMDGTYYKRIGIFRRPDEAGPLLNIDSLKNEKKEIERIIYENIIFSEKCEDDFGYSISDDSKNHVYDLQTSLNECITVEIQQIVEKIDNYFRSIEKDNSHDIYYLLSKFKFIHNIFTEFICNLCSDVSSIKHFIMNYDELDIDIFEMNLKNIENYKSYMNFLELVSDKKTLKRSEYMNVFSNLMTFIRVSQNWYYFLVDLYSILSNYSIQKDISEFDVTNLIELCLNNKIDVLTNSTTFKEFLHFINERIQERSFEPLSIESGFSLNREKVISLKHVLNHISYKPLKEQPSADKIVIKGAYINLDTLFVNSFDKKVKYIEIYATNKVFISEDINKTGSRTHLSIISPVWEVIGDRKIVLDGSPGSAYNEINNCRTNCNGNAGAPGKAGGPGGNFFGIAGKVCGGFLEITAKGGTGGPGGDGKSGEDGTKGEDGPPPFEIQIVLSNIGLIQQYNGFEYIVKEIMRVGLPFVSGHVYEYRGFGKKSTSGCDGGNGGVGGKGGFGGEIRVIDLSNSGKISFSNSNGEDGPQGRGGEGGKGVENGRTITALTDVKKLFFYEINSIEWRCVKYENAETFSKHGSRGVDGVNKVGWEEPEIGENMVDYFAIVNSYKIWASKSLSSWIGDPSLPAFIQNIERFYCQNESKEMQHDSEGSRDKLGKSQNESKERQNESEGSQDKLGKSQNESKERQNESEGSQDKLGKSQNVSKESQSKFQ